MTLAELNTEVKRRLSASAYPDEMRDTARLVMEDLANADPVRIFTRGDLELEPETVDRVLKAVDEIVAGRPPQYAVGRARFEGMNLKVSPDTLIPRPETQGLVDMIVDRWSNRSDLDVLDIGTGSGCIAIALSRALPFAKVEGIDISDAALGIARQNAEALHAPVDFTRSDILTVKAPSAAYDIIVSNPPYITMSERADMDRRVTDFEPAQALFVPDDDPLRFYRAITTYAATALRPGGMLYFEINSRFGSEVASLLTDAGLTDVTVERDYLGRPRFVKGCR